jgi:hypothetical protein
MAIIEQGMRKLEHRGSMSACCARGEAVTEDAAAYTRDQCALQGQGLCTMIRSR